MPPFSANRKTRCVSCLLEIPAPQPRQGSHPGPGVGQHPQYGAIPQSYDAGEVQGAEQRPRLPGGQLGRLAVHDDVLPPPHGGKRVQGGGVAGHQGVEEMPHRRQRLVLGGVRSGQLLDEAAGEARRDLTQLDSLRLAPSQKAPHGTGIGASSMGIAEPGREELIGGEQRGLPGSFEDGRNGFGQDGGAGNELVHI